jgi:hypothetical protein
MVIVVNKKCNFSFSELNRTKEIALKSETINIRGRFNNFTLHPLTFCFAFWVLYIL